MLQHREIFGVPLALGGGVFKLSMLVQLREMFKSPTRGVAKLSMLQLRDTCGVPIIEDVTYCNLVLPHDHH